MWMCEKCKFSENDVSLSNYKCKKCNSFITLQIIKNKILEYIENHKKDTAVKQFIVILKWFSNDEFIKYHSLIKLENLLLQAINIIIFYNSYNMLKLLFDIRVKFVFHRLHFVLRLLILFDSHLNWI